MMRTIASAVFLFDSVIIGLGAFGHGSQAARVHAALDGFPIDPSLHSMIFVVWYFVSACMLTFGITLVWVWMALRRGDSQRFAAAALIGTLYIGIGLFGLVYRHGDPFMGLFVALGVLLLGSGLVLASQTRTRLPTG